MTDFNYEGEPFMFLPTSIQTVAVDGPQRFSQNTISRVYKARFIKATDGCFTSQHMKWVCMKASELQFSWVDAQELAAYKRQKKLKEMKEAAEQAA